MGKSLDMTGFFAGGGRGIRTLGSFWEHDISSVVRLWQIHGWSRSFQVALSRAGNPGTARSFGHSDPYLPEAI